MKKKEIVVILDDIRSALNVGAILRTCDGAGIIKVYICGITPKPSHEKVKKTALGAETYVTCEYVKSIGELIRRLRSEGYNIVAVEQDPKAKKIQEFKTTRKMALVFGNELLGISIETLKSSDIILEIPMFGRKNSLNVATSLGIVLYLLILKP